MSAALIDLVSVGAQDVYITGEPQVSFFRQNYKRYTNFAMKPERMDYIGVFAANNEITIPIRSKGDLLSYIWIEANGIAGINTNTAGLFSSDASAPTEFELWIGGQMVVRLDSLYIQGVHNLLMRDNSAKASCAVTTNTRKGNHGGDYYMIPFFFCEDWTRTLPLVGLQYHDIELRIKLRDGYTPTDNVPPRCTPITSTSTQMSANISLTRTTNSFSPRFSTSLQATLTPKLILAISTIPSSLFT